MFATCTHIIVSLLKSLEGDLGRDRVRRMLPFNVISSEDLYVNTLKPILHTHVHATNVIVLLVKWKIRERRSWL